MYFQLDMLSWGGSVADWLTCWTQGRVQIAAVTLSGNSIRHTVHTHRAFVHQAAKLAVALLRAAVGWLVGVEFIAPLDTV